MRQQDHHCRYRAGWKAFSEHRDVTANPHPRGTTAHKAWRAGWQAAMAAVVERVPLGPLLQQASEDARKPGSSPVALHAKYGFGLSVCRELVVRCRP